METQQHVIKHWINQGTYYCPGCKHTMRGERWALGQHGDTCPHCHKYELRDFVRAHK